MSKKKMKFNDISQKKNLSINKTIRIAQKTNKYEYEYLSLQKMVKH